jgi:hypothetical protein
MEGAALWWDRCLALGGAISRAAALWVFGVGARKRELCLLMCLFLNVALRMYAGRWGAADCGWRLARLRTAH